MLNSLSSTRSFMFSLISHSKILLSQFKNRGRIGIVIDILDAVMRGNTHGRTKTQIMRGAKLNYDQTNRYLDLLMLCDFIRGQKLHYGDRESVQYSLTPRGFELFRQLHTLHSALVLLDNKSA